MSTLFKIVLLSFFLFSTHVRAEDKNDILKQVRSYSFEDARLLIRNLKNTELKKSFFTLVDLYENKGLYRKNDTISSFSFISISKSTSNYVQIIEALNKGLYNLYYQPIGQNNKTFYWLNIALNKALVEKNKPLICEVIKGFLQYYQTIVSINDHTFKKYLDIYNSNIYDAKEQLQYEYYDNIISFERARESTTTKKILPNLYKLTNKISIPVYLSRLYLRIGNFHFVEKKDMDSTSYYYNKSKNSIGIPRKGYQLEAEIKVVSNGARMLISQSPFEARQKLKSMLKSYKGVSFDIHKIYIDYYLSLSYQATQQNDSAYIYLLRSSRAEKKLSQEKHLASIFEIHTKYQTDKKEKEITKQRYFLIAILLFMLLGGIITYLIFKNSRKKRLLAEQQKSLEQQKNLALLKEQEIKIINAMVNGQEKERIRIAEDLHDNIGSVLATLKLHFENLKINKDKKYFNQDELYHKTENLIDEAYLKIRSIAHAKNSGVIANEGLLPAIKILAEKISAANKITIDVVDYGLHKRLENGLEITVFRIIQELITNVLKHSNASCASINISQFEEHLNIIIEDNGIGFNKNNMKTKSGMGIHSIQKRITHLSGNFEIDSTTNKGTSILIDIPI